MRDVDQYKQIVRIAITRLGYDGEWWAKGTSAILSDNRNCGRCMIGAIAVSTGNPEFISKVIIPKFREWDSRIKLSIPSWNDRPERTWFEVRDFLYWLLNTGLS